MNDIFTNPLSLDVFCMDIIEAWIDHCKRKNLKVTYDDFLDWVTELDCGLESNFDEVYKDEFGHYPDEEDEDDED